MYIVGHSLRIEHDSEDNSMCFKEHIRECEGKG